MLFVDVAFDKLKAGGMLFEFGPELVAIEQFVFERRE